ncbi:hypothetical protein ABZ816_37090 [Actinosynnema sp. NPDC047251]|uniref:Putative membrane protein n=1 Tax=Saccharothrix espanaensis (strain ATCC 51144 / DSM 44229 / JCM 9112 / NBRC 15066 / NRRL 15764) TaxID=1179773 RepID=K0K7Q2_SACES|nr:hypothetical protein [Saccharothrix espanaensis]CCH32643.1 putative membrane protein [Saccharothrix espanaensis DSM 44229]
MSPLSIALRRGAAPIAVPVMALLGLYAGTRGDSWFVDWGWASGQLQQHGVLLVPLTAAIAAWDASRDRRTGTPLLIRTYSRPQLTWLLLNGAGALIAGMIGWTMAFATIAMNVRGGGGPYWSVVLLGPLCIVASVLLGAAAGHYLPRYLAAPLAAVAVWLGLAFGSTSADPLIARLSAVNRECCDVASQPVAVTVAGQWLWILGLGLVGLAVLALPRVVVVAVVAALATLVATTAVAMIQSTDGQLTEARSATAESCATRDGITVCMWPEHAADVDAWLTAAARFRDAFTDIAPPAPLYLENGLRPGADAPRVGPTRPTTTDTDLVMSLAQNLFPVPPACAAVEGGSRGYPAAESNVLLNAWLIHRVRPEEPAARLVPPDYVADLDRLIRSPAERQRAWYTELLEAHRDCATPSPALPS